MELEDELRQLLPARGQQSSSHATPWSLRYRLACSLICASMLCWICSSRSFGSVRARPRAGVNERAETLLVRALELPVPCEADCAGVNVSVFYAIKSSSKPKYIERAAALLSTWGRWCVGRMALFSDDDNPALTHELQGMFPNISFVEVPGTRDFNRYHNYFKKHSHNRDDLKLAWAAQRQKTRAAIRHYLHERQESHLCYFDDDIYVHVPNLELELSERFMYCQDCMVADRVKHRLGQKYANNGWCMTRQFAKKAMEAIDKDKDIGRWTTNDDVNFAKFLEANNMTMHDSDLWCGQYAELVDDGQSGLKHLGYHDPKARNVSQAKNVTALCSMSMLHVGKLADCKDMCSWHELVNSLECRWRASCEGSCPSLNKPLCRRS